MIVRPAGTPDLAAIQDLERQCMLRPWSAAHIEQELRSPNCLSLLVETESGVIVGYGLFRVLPPEAEVLRIGVHPENRKRGAGAMVLHAALAELAAAGVQRVFLEVRPSNEAAGRLYQRFGFVAYAQRPGYYREPAEHAQLMHLSI